MKIGADELPAVSQLFTEDCMVEFLLHDSIGAWCAGKQGPVRAETEEQARSAVALPILGLLNARHAFARQGGTVALVARQNWLFLPGYKQIRQDAFELRVLLLDGDHGIVDQFPDRSLPRPPLQSVGNTDSGERRSRPVISLLPVIL